MNKKLKKIVEEEKGIDIRGGRETAIMGFNFFGDYSVVRRVFTADSAHGGL